MSQRAESAAPPNPERGAKPTAGAAVDPASGEPQIIVERLTKRFGDYQALADINMRVQKSHVAVIIGGSGAGKTTLLKILIGLDRPTSGHIYVDGQDMAQLGERALNKLRQKFGMVFQYSALLDSMNVMENVAFPLREHTKLRDKEIRDRVSEKLKILGLEGTESRYPSQLSGGMRKRVALARALMLEPSILMYDEPTSGLDPITARMVDELILETRDRFGVTSIVISHDMAGALRIADEIYLLSKGRIAVSGSPAELVKGDNATVQEFLESSGINADQLIAEAAGKRRQ
ncbi:MAG TPA: ABC transporter ATP-binding protein [Polyangiaceae bacterium]|nr:ABC transporter ATP-binding protein [Polyangiaceae bacterium]